jgi:hypothetical protein
MKPICHLNIDIPVLQETFVFPNVDNVDPSTWRYFEKIPTETTLSKEIKQFFIANGLFPFPGCLLFYAPPGAKLNLHKDGGGPNAWAMNWSLTKDKAGMIWFNELNKGVEKVVYANTTPTAFTSYKDEDLEEFYREEIGYPSLVKIGIPHGGFNNSDKGAWLLSVRFQNMFPFEYICSELKKFSNN